MKNSFYTTSPAEAWRIADTLFPTDYLYSSPLSERAGYPIYKSTLVGCEAWISDLGTSLEVNLENGETIRIWIDEPAEQEITPERYTLTLDRNAVCDLLLACTGIVIDSETEKNDTSTTKGRREVLVATIAKWQGLHDRIKKQLDELDALCGIL